MDFKVHIPHPALQPYIHYYALVGVGIRNSWSAIAMAPTGCGVLGVVVGDKKFLCQDGDAPSPAHAELLTYAGQLTHFKELQLFGQQTLVYAIMKPCGAYRLLGIGQHHFINRSSDLLNFLPTNERPILHQFEDCQTHLETLTILDALLLRLLIQRKEKHNLARIAAVSESLMQHLDEPLYIKKICREEGFSKSTLERNFMEYVGIGPKQYHRIARFNNALRYVRQQKEFSHWTEVVYRFGYYDQSHFIKDFKLFCGKTPSDFSTNAELLSNIIQ